MQLKLYKTLWGFDGDYVGAVAAAAAAGFDGIEGPAPEDADERRRFRRALVTHGLDYIAEICTAGGYVPDRHASPAEHLASLGQRLARSRELDPRFVTSKPRACMARHTMAHQRWWDCRASAYSGAAGCGTCGPWS